MCEAPSSGGSQCLPRMYSATFSSNLSTRSRDSRANPRLRRSRRTACSVRRGSYVTPMQSSRLGPWSAPSCASSAYPPKMITVTHAKRSPCSNEDPIQVQELPHNRTNRTATNQLQETSSCSKERADDTDNHRRDWTQHLWSDAKWDVAGQEHASAHQPIPGK